MCVRSALAAHTFAWLEPSCQWCHTMDSGSSTSRFPVKLGCPLLRRSACQVGRDLKGLEKYFGPSNQGCPSTGSPSMCAPCFGACEPAWGACRVDGSRVGPHFPALFSSSTQWAVHWSNVPRWRVAQSVVVGNIHVSSGKCCVHQLSGMLASSVCRGS